MLPRTETSFHTNHRRSCKSSERGMCLAPAPERHQQPSQNGLSRQALLPSRTPVLMRDLVLPERTIYQDHTSTRRAGFPVGTGGSRYRLAPPCRYRGVSREGHIPSYLAYFGRFKVSGMKPSADKARMTPRIRKLLLKPTVYWRAPSRMGANIRRSTSLRIW